MIYVYGCKQGHREEVVHSMKEDPVVVCSVCGKQMHRIPQPVMHYHNPALTLVDQMESEYIQYRNKRKGKRK